MRTAGEVGKIRRQRRIIRGDGSPSIIVPLDDSLIAGPHQGLHMVETTLSSVIDGCPDAVLAFPGLIRRHAELLADLPVIVNISASTVLGQHTEKVLVSQVSMAARLDSDAVAAHLNVSSKFEPKMLRDLGRVVREAEDIGMPVLAIAYPRRESANGDDNYVPLRSHDRAQYAQLVAHAVRIAIDVGADMVKTQFTGDAESFRYVIEAAGGCPVLVAGGPLLDESKALEMALEAANSGVAGISYGRNVFHRVNPARFLTALRLRLQSRTMPSTTAK